MPNIDERIVSIAFENRKFESAVSETLKTLGKLDSTLQQVGSKNSLANIEKAAEKVTLNQPLSALDKLKGRLFGAGTGAAQGMSDIEKAGSKVSLVEPIRALDKVRAATAQVGAEAANGFNEIERSSSQITLSALSSSLDGVTAKFSILRGAASVALGNIATQATMRGAAFAKSFVFAPISQGLDEYKTNLNSIQTILANTQGQKVSGLDNVNKALGQLNTYSDKTIYNFSQMARNIGTFTAAGVDLPKSVAAIKGIANLAALSGSNSDQASHAMYQLSQAIAAGRVGLQDWNSVVNAGMGGAVFQKALLRTADNMGTISKGALKIDKATGKATVNGQSFRESIMAKPGKQSWLTSDVLTKTLSQFTGDLSNAQLQAQGFSASQIKAIQAQAKTAQAAATQVKTLSQVFDVAKETIGSGWSRTFQLIFGDFKESKKTFTELSNTINGVINRMSKARNRILGDWKKLGGRTDLIAGIKNAFVALKAVIDPIKNAFRDIFPATTGKQLADLTARFRDFMARLKIGPKTADLLRRTFRGLFALLDIGRKIIAGVFTVFTHMFGAVSSGAGSLLGFAATVGDLITFFRNWLDQGNRLQKFFNALGSVLAVPTKLIGVLLGALGSLFNTDFGDSTANKVTALSDAMNPLSRLGQAAAKAWDGVVNALKAVANFLQPVIDTLRNALSQVGDVIAGAFSGANVEKMLAGIQVGLIAGIFLSIKKAIGGGASFNFKAEIGGLSQALGIMTGSLKSMQTAVKAATLLQIAAAVGILAVSVAILANVDPKKLASSMTAMSIGLAQLVGAMAILGKTSGKGGGFLKLPVIAASMILLSTALLILTGTMLIMSRMNWDQIAKGLAGISGLLLGLSVAVQPISKASPGLILAGTGIIAISVALTILAGAMKIFATMSWEEMAKGLTAVFLTLSAIGIASRALGPQLLLTGPGLILVAIGLAELAGVIKLFATMSVGDIAKGIGAIAAGIVAIGLAMSLMPITLPVTAAGLILVGIALTALTGVIALLGNMNMDTLAKGIGAIGAALAVLAIGLTAMSFALPGAAALLTASAALAIFAPTLALMGNLNWGTIAKGLGVIAASMLVIGTTGLVAAPALILLGIGFAALGAGVLAIGAGVNLLAKGFALLGNSGKGLAVFTAAIVALIAVIPKVAIEFLKGIVDIADSVVKLAPALIGSFAKILDILIALVIKETPKLGLAALAFIKTLALVIINAVPSIVAAGIAIVLGLLRGIDQNIEEITTRALSIVGKFLGVLASHAAQFTAAGIKLIVNVINGIASKIGRVVHAATRLLTRFLGAIADGLPKVITAGAKILGSVVSGIAQGLGRIFNIGTRAVLRFLAGVANNVPKVIAKGVEIAAKFVHHVARGLVRLADVGAKAIIDFINGLAAVIEKRGPQLRAAGFRLAKAIMDGMTFGISKLGPKAFHAVTHVAGGLLNKAGSVLGIGSPSRKFHEIGKWSMIGLANGLQAGGLGSQRAVARTANNMLDAVRKVMSDMPVGLDNTMDLNPVISPVLDLSSVHKEAQKIPNMTSSVGLSTDVSLQQASAILAEKAAADKAQTESVKTAEKPSVKFEQNNYSPESLSTTEIYRRTNNQLSRVKKALNPVPG